MAFKKGDPQPPGSGRKKGGGNKRTPAELLKICEDVGVEPFEDLLKLSKSTRDEGIKVACLKECAKYIYPQMRSTEISGPGGGPISTEVQSSEVKELLAEVERVIDTKLNERKG